MKVIATPAIGAGTDGAGFDPGSGNAFSSNGGDGTMTVVKLVNGKYEAVDTVTTERGARTMTVDPTNHRIYMLAAEYGPPAEGKDGKKGRPTVVPDSTCSSSESKRSGIKARRCAAIRVCGSLSCWCAQRFLPKALPLGAASTSTASKRKKRSARNSPWSIVASKVY
jgi:hypothetical protein